jgi:UDP-N-acetylglucosamine:LPS N-acetylglucosamine transferase
MRGHQTQWAAQFAVAAELCKRGYEVAFTMGHTTPIADLMVVSPIRHETFLIDVKGLYRKNPWLIKRKKPRANLYYVLADVPTDEPNAFFVLTQAQVSTLIRTQLRRLGRSADYLVTGFNYSAVSKYRDGWARLPA